MNLPSQAQVNAVTRHIASAVGGGILVFGLSTKIDPTTVTNIIGAAGAVINDVIVLVGLVSPLIAGYYASKSASATSQAAAIGANKSTIVQPAPGGTATVTLTDPALASAALTAQKQTA